MGERRFNNIEFARSVINSLLSEIARENISLIIDQINIEFKRILIVGCNTGIEAYAFSMFPENKLVLGIDKEKAWSEKLVDIQAAVDFFDRYPYHKNSLWWGQLPSFIRNKKLPKFKEFTFGSPGKKLDQPNNSFDLAYCSNVLYTIYNKQGEVGFRVTIEEIYRLLSIGGHLVAIEPGDGDYGNFLKEKFQIMDKTLQNGLAGNTILYICKKTINN
jgi:SAM-dependent methyltransferase